MKLVLLIICLSLKNSVSLPPSCSKPVYCNSKLLHYVQMSRIYQDSKTFVDLHMKYGQNTTLKAFDAILNLTDNNPNKSVIRQFVSEFFDESSELENWSPTDYSSQPPFLTNIKDEKLRQFGKNINDIWPTLGRKVKDEVFENSDQYSLIPVDHGFVIPGGRFKELYYWDTYWIIEGLLLSEMKNTVKGVISNLLELVKKIGHIPNGSRWYYQERSQPPLLSGMMLLYFLKTNDIQFLKDNIETVEVELGYWLDTKAVTFNISDRSHTLLRYYAPSEGPRPESYYEDYSIAQNFNTTERRSEFYTDVKSAAETGWDFSSRWFINQQGYNNGSFTTIHASKIVPVDLNAIYAKALKNVAYFQNILNNTQKSTYWADLAEKWCNAIEEVFWNKEDGIWYDWDLVNKQHRKYFYPSNVAPLWMDVVNGSFVNSNAKRISEWLNKSHGLDYPGGIPTSLVRSGEQWDFPNAWPPLVSIVVNSLESLKTEDSVRKAFDIAQTWIRACYTGYSSTKQMFEKYDVEIPGKVGGGGEYNVQTGFGWSNGVVLEFLAKYGSNLTLNDSTNNTTSPNNNNTSTDGNNKAILCRGSFGTVIASVILYRFVW